MTSANWSHDWMHALRRFVVWLVAAVYLGRFYYNNSLYDLRRHPPSFYVLKTVSIGIVLSYAYWNVFVMPDRIAALLWTVVAFGSGMVLLFKLGIESAAEQATARTPLERRRFADRLDDGTSTGTTATHRPDESVDE